MVIKENIITLLSSTKRDGIEKLIQYLCEEGFFESPASTRYHGVYPGGLAEHSLQVYDLLFGYQNRLQLDKIVSPGQKPLPVSGWNLNIACLLHDVCKIGAYIPTGNGDYKWNKNQPKGHALLSITRIEQYIKLEEIERLMITYHMGVYGLNEFYEEGDYQTGEYPLRGDHSEDTNLSKEESQKARYGKSLANVWFHNPICKMMYFCDEIVSFRI
jgi:hypothetical protein